MKLRFIWRMIKYLMVFFGVMVLIVGIIDISHLLTNGIADIDSLQQLESKKRQYIKIKTELMDTGISVTYEDSDSISSYFYYIVLDGQQVLVSSNEKLDLSNVFEVTGHVSEVDTRDEGLFYEIQAATHNISKSEMKQQYSSFNISYSESNPYVTSILTILASLLAIVLGIAWIYTKHRKIKSN